MRTEKHQKVLERLATGDKPMIVIERQSDGKMRVTSGSWDGEKVILRDQVLEVSKVDGRLHVARKLLHHDEWDLPIAPYDPTGRASMSSLMTESVIDQAGPALHVTADRDRSRRSRERSRQSPDRSLRAVWGTKSVDD
jgi:hypothetical protein